MGGHQGGCLKSRNAIMEYLGKHRGKPSGFDLQTAPSRGMVNGRVCGMKMKYHPSRHLVLGFVVASLMLSGCGGDDAVVNTDPGNNRLDMVVAFGDSITRGSRCECPSYPSRLGPLIGKTVHNAGIPGSKAQDSVGRTRQIIAQHRPAYMLILYGVNDVIHSFGTDGIVQSVRQMVEICLANQVVPVVATYPVPIHKRSIFAGGTEALNRGIRDIARSYGIRLVDLDREFNRDPSLYEPDGLHPNDRGTLVMALAFADLF